MVIAGSASCATTWPNSAPKAWCNASAARVVIGSLLRVPSSVSSSSSSECVFSARSRHSLFNPARDGHLWSTTPSTPPATRSTLRSTNSALPSVSNTQREPDFRCSGSQNLALDELRTDGMLIQPEDVERLSPLVHHHIHLDGRYSFLLPEPLVRGELRPLRDPNDPAEQVFDLVAATA